MTVLDLINSVVTLLNINAVGDALGDAEADDIKQSLNDMLDQWKTEQFLMYRILDLNFAVSANTGTYTIGYGATWDTTPNQRPERIESAFCRDATGTMSIDFTMKPLNHNQYQMLPLKSIGTNYPTHYLYIPNWPNGTITLYPVPSQTLTCYLGVWMQFTTLNNLTDAISFPPGYVQEIKYGLAAELLTKYGTPSDMAEKIEKRAEFYRNALRTVNSEPVFSQIDPAIASRTRFSIYSGW
jgi:hypothetical protein